MSDIPFETSAPVLVTGATGYVAGWIVQGLLEHGVTVHAAVRDPDNSAKVAHLLSMAEGTPGQLVLFRADLLEEGSYAAAMAGCRVVIHTASPFTSDVEDAQRDLVDPAVKGTRNVLDTATATASVHRVVLTSSCAAIIGDAADLDGRVADEAIWNSTSSLEHQPYAYSKTAAERAAWEINSRQARWRLVVINPSLVVGPGTAERQTSDSFSILRQMGSGAFKSGVPPMEIGMVDVRDVAEAHLRAAFLPDAEGRHIISAESLTMLQLAEMLQEHAGGTLPITAREMPKWVVWLIGPMVSKTITRHMVARSMGYPWQVDNSKSCKALGMSYRPLQPAVTAMLQQLIDTGQLGRGS
ncbi:NAD-dependent epimerase/dehydratase family protein [Pseudooceanicola spongiae]|uniref:NAD-dependent epimerase/dehydratase family protein n=1 Tax=Pseudooceanicola spongiae TaxID=2613965 RepID=A0A7L9WKY2_9RHOB|nr:NAD-dependent epimerase/dehydratase family protein [Pseudooceanicola spongiae]QOL80563.1 NAD-dependent epimerase/dehydratase family protein [Pseudooceanicola spongiae]